MIDRNLTVETVTDGLARLIKEVRKLQSEVNSLTSALRGFTSSHPLPSGYNLLPPSAGGTGDWRTRPETDEPRSAIDQARYEYADRPNLEIPTRTILAIAKELDGSLRDIRAARLDIRAIADDSDLREDFKKWQDANR